MHVEMNMLIDLGEVVLVSGSNLHSDESGHALYRVQYMYLH
jgi:hypothetical protein